MIRVLRWDGGPLEAGAVMRSVGADLEACTSVGRRLGDQAGNDVLSRLAAFGELAVGGAVVTPGGNLSADLMIHVVVSSIDEPVSEQRVSKAFENGLRQAAQWGVSVLAVPPLGIGAGNLDVETSARIMCGLVREHARSASLPTEVVILAGSEYEEAAFLPEVARAPGIDAR